MIETLSLDTLEQCVALYVDTFNAEPWNESWTVEDADQRLGDFVATPRSHGFCMTGSDGEVLGFVLGHLERSGSDEHFLVQELCVRADMRRRGIATELVGALDRHLPEVDRWYLLTARDSAASTFYEGLGYRPAPRLGVFVRP